MTLHQYLTLDEKIALINHWANGTGLSQRKLCGKYKVSKGAVYNILQQKDEYEYIYICISTVYNAGCGKHVFD